MNSGKRLTFRPPVDCGSRPLETRSPSCFPSDQKRKEPPDPLPLSPPPPPGPPAADRLALGRGWGRRGGQRLTGQRFQGGLGLRDREQQGQRRCQEPLPPTKDPGNKGTQQGQGGQKWAGRAAPPKEGGVREDSGKAASIPGKVKERSRVPPSKDTKSLKVAGPGKLEPCPFRCRNFSQNLRLRVWALGTSSEGSPAQMPEPLALWAGLPSRLYHRSLHPYVAKNAPRGMSRNEVR